MNALNREQHLASRAEGGTTLVIAGAGTGKTRTIIQKVCNIVLGGIARPEEVLILTFSRKAAGEIRGRIVGAVGDGADAITASTFHSFALSLLKSHGREFLEERGYRAFPSVMDESGACSIIRELVSSDPGRYLGIPVRVLCGLVSGAETLSRKTEKRIHGTGIRRHIEELKSDFRKEKLNRSLMDFDDIMDLAVTMLEKNPAIRTLVASKWKYILVDEFQDTSDDNFALLNLLLPDEGKNLFVVGDDWQSIYGFRDARVEYIIRLKRYFPSLSVHRLVTNYRSRKEIVTVSGRLIGRNRFRTRKRMRSHRGGGGRVVCLETYDYADEVRVIEEVLEAERKGYGSGTAAVLFRNNWQGAFIKSRLSAGVLDDPGVSLMTMHASKGLEFTAVIIAGVNDAVIPDRGADIEEERRLFYVALTRARDRLYCLWQHNEAHEKPRFIREIAGYPVEERLEGGQTIKGRLFF